MWQEFWAFLLFLGMAGLSLGFGKEMSVQPGSLSSSQIVRPFNKDFFPSSPAYVFGKCLWAAADSQTPLFVR